MSYIAENLNTILFWISIIGAVIVVASIVFIEYLRHKGI